jgi:NADH-quinone oxidoreductase subunit J
VISVLATAATIPDVITFAVAAIITLAGAVGVVLSRNPVHAALSLVGTLFGIAVLFVEQEAHFLAAVQVIVYAGAIVILFLFVIMLLGVDQPDDGTTRDKFKAWRPFAVLLALAMSALVVGLASWDWKATGAKSVGGTASGAGSNVEKLADSIFTQYLLPFEATSFLLIIAVVGAVILARRPSVEDEAYVDVAGENADALAQSAGVEEITG